MRFPLISYFTFVCIALGTAQVTTAAERIRATQSSHPLDAYAIGALKLAVSKLDGRYSLEVLQNQYTQSRAIEELESGNMEVMWLASNNEVEERLRPVRFPLLKGLLGHRINIINPNHQSRFDRVKAREDVSQLSFGQGIGWPDVAILEANGFNVVTTSKYNSLFYMVEGGRFDGFPRGVLEPWIELDSRPELDLTVEKNLVFVYTLPFYLFVARDNRELAEALQRGLDIALEDGSFDEYFFNDDMVKSAIKRSNLDARIKFPLTNPELNKNTPLDRKEYWLDVSAAQN